MFEKLTGITWKPIMDQKAAIDTALTGQRLAVKRWIQADLDIWVILSDYSRPRNQDDPSENSGWLRLSNINIPHGRPYKIPEFLNLMEN